MSEREAPAGAMGVGKSALAGASRSEARAIAAASRPRLSLRKKLLFSLFLIVFSLGLIEVGLRIAFPRLTWPTARTAWEGGATPQANEDEWPPNAPKGARGVRQHLEYDVAVSYNSDGFRCAEFDAARSPIVVVIGDSTTAGYGVQAGEMFSNLLEGDLRHRFSHLQVWNAAHSGTGIVQQARFLERVLTKYPRADIRAVVLFANLSRQTGAGNDLLDSVGLLPYLRGGAPPHPPGHSLKFRVLSLLRNIALLRGPEVISSRWRRTHVRNAELPDLERAWGEYVQGLDRVYELCRQRGAALLIGYIDLHYTATQAEIDEMLARFEQYAAPRQIAVVNCCPHFSALRDSDWFFPVDGHPKPVAHRYFADQLKEPLARLLDVGRTQPASP